MVNIWHDHYFSVPFFSVTTWLDPLLMFVKKISTWECHWRKKLVSSQWNLSLIICPFNYSHSPILSSSSNSTPCNSAAAEAGESISSYLATRAPSVHLCIASYSLASHTLAMKTEGLVQYGYHIRPLLQKSCSPIRFCIGDD